MVNDTNPGLFSSVAIDATTHELTTAYAKNANGTATLTIRATDASGQWVDVPLTVQVDPINHPPVLAINAGLSVEAGSSTTITRDLLRADDSDNGPAELTYRVANVPAEGHLTLDGKILAAGNTFTQADIDAGKLKYVQGGSVHSDRFTFTVSDGSGGAINPSDFAITVAGGQVAPPLQPAAAAGVDRRCAGPADDQSIRRQRPEEGCAGHRGGAVAGCFVAGACR